MENKKFFKGYNADKEFINYIKQELYYYKCVLISSNQDRQNNINFINDISEVFSGYNFVELPDNALDNKLVYKLIEKHLTDDVGLVIVIGNHGVLNFVSSKFNNVAFVCTMPSLVQLSVKSNFIVYSYNRVLGCSHNYYTSCLGEIVSIFAYVLEQVFNACIYNTKVDGTSLIKLEKYLFNIANMPLGIINSNFGKQYVCKLTETIAKLLNKNFYNSSVLMLANNLTKANLNFGCALGYSSKIFFNAFDYVFNLNYINCLVGFNARVRVDQFNNFNNVTNDFIDNNLNNFYNKTFDLYNKFNTVKNDFCMVLGVYKKMFLRLYTKFLNLQFDKGFLHNNQLKPRVIFSAFNKLPEQSLSANFVTFLREFGFLNNL